MEGRDRDRRSDHAYYQEQGRLMPTKPPRTRRATLVWLGVVGMVIAGIGVGLALVLVTALPLTLETDMSALSIVAAFSLATLIPAVALWLTRNRYWRGLAVGLAAVWSWLALSLLVDLLVSDDEGDDSFTGVAELSDA